MVENRTDFQNSDTADTFNILVTLPYDRRKGDIVYKRAALFVTNRILQSFEISCDILSYMESFEVA